MGGAGDADTGALAQTQGAVGGLRRRMARHGHGTKPEGAGSAQVGAVERAVNAHGGRESTGAPGQIEQARGIAVRLHVANALERLKRPDKDATPDTFDFRTHIEHEVIAITKVDVGMAAAKEHGAISRRWPAKMVSGRVALRIGLGFNDPAAQASSRQFAHHNFAYQKAG